MSKIRGFEIVTNNKRKFADHDVKLPKRGTSNSAGYDFYSNEGDITIQPGQKHVFWTDIKAYMNDGEVLSIYVRSSIGIKKGLGLANQVGIIDADYYSNESNDGNIGICLINLTGKLVTVGENERIAQGIFTTYLISDNCNSDEVRTGGVGHTGTK